MGDHNQSLVLLKNFCLAHGTHWQQIYFIGKEWNAVFSKYFLVRKLANSTSAAICAELATIVTELGLPHIIRSGNGPCYNSKEFQQFLQ